MISKEIAAQIRPGSKIRVCEKIKEKNKERTSIFEGLVISRKHGSEAGATFTVRRVISGIGVEKIFPLHSPQITNVEILQSPKKIRRAKLYYLRGLSSRGVREKTNI